MYDHIDQILNDFNSVPLYSSMNVSKTKESKLVPLVIGILLLCLSVVGIEAQNIVPLPNGNSIDPFSPSLLTDETVYFLGMTGAVRTRVSESCDVLI